MSEQDLQSASDPRQLKKAAVNLARSDQPADHEALSRHLGTQSLLDRLDSKDAYQGTARELRLAKVIKALMDNRLPSTDQVLIKLIYAPDYQQHVLRRQLLIYGLAVVKPAPKDSVAYWDKHSPPKGSLATDVVTALCINQSPPALELLEAKFADPKHADHRKLVWMRDAILTRRNDALLLGCCQQMITKSLPDPLRGPLAEALFGYQPAKWYRACEPPSPPPRSEARPAARRTLREIGRFALANVKLTAEQEQAVQAGLNEL